jgi:hypothetical protein
MYRCDQLRKQCLKFLRITSTPPWSEALFGTFRTFDGDGLEQSALCIGQRAEDRGIDGLTK